MGNGADEWAYVIDDNCLVRGSLEDMLLHLKFNTQCFTSGAEFLSEQKKLRPGVVFLDVRMPELDGWSVLDRLLSLWTHAPVVMISGHGDVPMAVNAMRSGASYFLEKPFGPDELSMVIETVARPMLHSAAGSIARFSAKDAVASLTKREAEILKHLVDGHQNRAIAQMLGISPRTVEVHRARIMMRLRASSFAHLVRIAIMAEND